MPPRAAARGVRQADRGAGRPAHATSAIGRHEISAIGRRGETSATGLQGISATDPRAISAIGRRAETSATGLQGISATDPRAISAIGRRAKTTINASSGRAAHPLVKDRPSAAAAASVRGDPHRAVVRNWRA